MPDSPFPRFAERLDSGSVAGATPLPPIAEFTAVPTGLTVQFTDQSVDPDGVVRAWQWDFGDALNAPTARFAFVPSGLSVVFTDQSTDVAPGAIVAWAWTFGDGTTATVRNPTHAYATAGSYNATLRVTDNQGLQSGIFQRVVAVGSQLGVPWGLSQSFQGSASLKPGTDLFTSTKDPVTPGNLIPRLTFCRNNGLSMQTNMTGGAHAQYMTGGAFDRGKWSAVQQGFNTPAIRDAVTQGVEENYYLGNEVMDEPHNITAGNGWGPPGTMTKAIIDDMAAEVKSIFPTLPVGVTHVHYIFQPTVSYHIIDYVVVQYNYRKGEINGFKADALALGARDNHQICFAINVVNGGIPSDPPAAWDCPLATTGGRGDATGLCRVTAQQYQDWAINLGRAGCGLIGFKYDLAFVTNAANRAAFAVVRADLATAPRKSFRRFGP